MSSKKKQPPLLEAVEISAMAAEGKSIARVGEMVVFVPYGAPGDVVDIQLSKKKRNYAEGWIRRFRQYSPLRVEPFCEHFTDCGGCKWQHVPYELQLQHKQQEVMDALTRIGKLELPDVSAIKGSEQTVCYRNKLEYTFSDRGWKPFLPASAPDRHCERGEAIPLKEAGDCFVPRNDGTLEGDCFVPRNDGTLEGDCFVPRNDDAPALGFHVPGRFDKVLDITKCHLQDDISNRIRLFIKQYCVENGYSFFNLRSNAGFMRTLIVRTTSTGETMAIVVFHGDDPTRRNSLLEAVQVRFPEITSLMYVINDKLNDVITDLEVITCYGKDYLTERMEELQFRIGPKSFFQTNSRQANVLYNIVREFAGLTGAETVYDLYTGTGTIALFVARSCKKVIGIEYVNEAIEDARINAELNNIINAEFFAGDMKDILTEEFISEHGKPDVVITDPPRSGMHDDVIEMLLAVAPRRIVYVSCNPATQARDLNRLSEAYRVIRVQPVDMFPHTHHVENVVLLERLEV